MNTTEIILDEMVYLPKNLHREVLDFIEFLMNKHQVVAIQEQDKIAEYDRLFALLLSKRNLFECKKCKKLRPTVKRSITDTNFCKVCRDESIVTNECQCKELSRKCDLCLKKKEKIADTEEFFF